MSDMVIGTRLPPAYVDAGCRAIVNEDGLPIPRGEHVRVVGWVFHQPYGLYAVIAREWGFAEIKASALVPEVESYAEGQW